MTGGASGSWSRSPAISGGQQQASLIDSSGVGLVRVEQNRGAEQSPSWRLEEKPDRFEASRQHGCGGGAPTDNGRRRTDDRMATAGRGRTGKASEGKSRAHGREKRSNCRDLAKNTKSKACFIDQFDAFSPV